MNNRTNPAHDPEEAARWFDQWHVYRSIVDHGWMSHGEIFRGIRRWVDEHRRGPFSLLDVGCGDCGSIRETFAGTGLSSYTGVDASPTALSRAREELAGAGFGTRFVQADMLDYLRAPAGGGAVDADDLVVASYSVHHLPTAEKRVFLGRVHARLRPGGGLLLADVFRRADETREQYLEAYVGMMRSTWRGLSPESLGSTVEHVEQRDFPETVSGFRELAAAAGFRTGARELFHDESGFHRLFCLLKETSETPTAGVVQA